MRSIVRVLVGYVIACFMGGLTTVLFVYTPDEVGGWLASLPGEESAERLSTFGLLWLAATTQSAVFSIPFAFIVAVVGEWRRIREWTYYAVAGIVTAMLGFAAQWLSEVTGQNWSVVGSSYPAVAFLTTGFVAGFVYWMFAGRKAGGSVPAAPVKGPEETAKTAKTADKPDAAETSAEKTRASSVPQEA